jgi:GAF domain-containing protein
MRDEENASPARRPLTIDDLSRLNHTLRSAADRTLIFPTVEALAREVIGHRMFTIMRFDAERIEVERLYSSHSDAYPVGGRKKKARTLWADHVLHGMRVHYANTPDAVRAAFDDHDTIFCLGIGAILNIPLIFSGRCIGTMNLSHAAEWFRDEDAETGMLLGAFLVPAVLQAGC